MVPAEDQAMVLPWTSVMVIMVLLKLALTCATPEAMFLRSRRRTRVASLPILNPFGSKPAEPVRLKLYSTRYFFLPAIGLVRTFRRRQLVWVCYARTGSRR